MFRVLGIYNFSVILDFPLPERPQLSAPIIEYNAGAEMTISGMISAFVNKYAHNCIIRWVRI
jgi:hypothetical protein